jgi:hypothetical protein
LPVGRRTFTDVRKLPSQTNLHWLCL